MAACARLPVRIILGDSAPHEVGTIEIPVTVDADGSMVFQRPPLADVLRAMADSLDEPEGS